MQRMSKPHPSWKGELDEEFLLELTCAKHLNEIEELQLSNFGLKDEHLLPQVLNELSSLVEVDLSNNLLTIIPNGIVLPKLQYLDLGHNCISNVEWLARFPHLKDLDIADNVGLTIDDRYKIIFLLEQLQFLDGKRVDEREKICEKFTTELLAQMQKLWMEQFEKLWNETRSDKDTDEMLEKFTKVAKQKVRFGPNSLKGYRLWRIENIAKEFIKIKIYTSGKDLMDFLISPMKTDGRKTYPCLKPTSDVPSWKTDILETNLCVNAFTFEPVALLQCHSKREGAADFSTQVWCSLFEPDVNERLKTTNAVATCGGNTVCIIDCATNRVEARFDQINEEFYTMAWLTVDINGQASNILVAAGCLGIIHLIHSSQAVCYGRISLHSSPIQAMLSSPLCSTHLLSADKSGNIYLIDVGTPTLPNYKFEWKQLARFTGLESSPLKLQVCMDCLLTASESGLFCWQSKHLFNPADKILSTLRIAMTCEILFPCVDVGSMVDGLVVINDNLVASKCVQQGVIFLWQFPDVLKKKVYFKKAKKIEVELLAELKWSSTPQYYINIAACSFNMEVFVGDDAGNVWFYDVSTLVEKKKTSDGKKLLCPMILPFAILPFPQCTRPNGTSINKLKHSKPIYNDVCCNHDMKFLVAAADNNLVAIYKKTEALEIS